VERQGDFYSRAEAKKALKLSVASLHKLEFLYLHPLKRKDSGRVFYRREEVERVAFLLKREIPKPLLDESSAYGKPAEPAIEKSV
jgi:hypothetical protein